MVDYTAASVGTSSTTDVGSLEPQDRAMPFVLVGSVTFAPDYFPETVRVRKQRQVDRKKNFCTGEDVTDNGGKNYEIHVNGVMLTNDIRDFRGVLDDGGDFDLSTTAWSGEVKLDEGEYEGPNGWDGQQSQWQYEYTIDLIATGAERPEFEKQARDGIIEAPESDPSNQSRQGIR